MGEDSLVYEVQKEKRQDGKRKRLLHRNMLLPYEVILEEPGGFHLKKEKHKKPRQAASYKFTNNTGDTEISEYEFHGLTPIQIRRVKTREGPAIKDSERGSAPAKHEDIQLTIDATNNPAAARQQLDKTRSRKKYRESQDADKAENQCRKRQDLGCTCTDGAKKYPLRNRNGARPSSQRDLLAPISNYKKTNQAPTAIDKKKKNYFNRPEPKG